MSQPPAQQPSAQQYGPPMNPQQGYGQQGYGPAQQQYGVPIFPPPPAKSINGPAAAFLLIGGFIGFVSMFLNWVSRLRWYTGFEVVAEDLGHGGSEGALIAIGLYVVFIGGFVCLVTGGLNLVPATGHRALNIAALVFASLMTITSLVAFAAFSSYLDGAGIGHYFFLAAGYPCLIGAIIGVIRK